MFVLFVKYIEHTIHIFGILETSRMCTSEGLRAWLHRKRTGLQDMWSNLIISVSGIESCLNMNHLRQSIPEGICGVLLHSFTWKVTAKKRDTFQLNTEASPVSTFPLYACVVYTALYIDASCEVTISGLSHQNGHFCFRKHCRQKYLFVWSSGSSPDSC